MLLRDPQPLQLGGDYLEGVELSRPSLPFVEVNPNRFKELRTACSLSVRQRAEKAGVFTETIYSLEHGRRGFIWPKTARKLAQALEVDPAELVD